MMEIVFVDVEFLVKSRTGGGSEDLVGRKGRKSCTLTGGEEGGEVGVRLKDTDKW